MDCHSQANQVMAEIKKQSFASNIITILNKMSANVKFQGHQVLEIIKKSSHSEDQVKLAEGVQNHLDKMSPNDMYDILKLISFSEPQLKVFKAIYRSINDKSKKSFDKVLSAFTFSEQKKQAEALLNSL